MADYSTPGVYVEEKSSFPPSVAGVATAVPAFIGYTKDGPLNNPTPITSLLEYQKLFGTGSDFSLTADKKLKGQEYCLYDSIRLFYDNGGGDCYIVSIGNYPKKDIDSDPDAEGYKAAIDSLEKIPDVTILVFPDAATLLDASTLKDVQTAALDHCYKMGGRFTILDLSPVGSKETTVTEGEGDQTVTKTVMVDSTELRDVVGTFRTNIGTNNLCYGAAYYPYLKSSYKKDIPASIVLKAMGAEEPPKEDENNPVTQEVPAKNVAYGLSISDDPENALKLAAMLPTVEGYADKLAELQEAASLIPPSGAIAGIYAATDNRVGVWQAPANVSISCINGLSELLSDAQQNDMNKPANGKAVNAIRFFKGKGYLVWGCRTLLGNDNEWKYVNVRRFFNYVEQSLKLATDWAVFQPNDANTWIKIQCQVESFLTTLWRDGALAGATPDKAFFVEVGLGKTMDSGDILNGNLRVRIGMAAVRPAEFIILEFSHKVQE